MLMFGFEILILEECKKQWVEKCHSSDDAQYDLDRFLKGNC